MPLPHLFCFLHDYGKSTLLIILNSLASGHSRQDLARPKSEAETSRVSHGCLGPRHSLHPLYFPGVHMTRKPDPPHTHPLHFKWGNLVALADSQVGSALPSEQLQTSLLVPLLTERNGIHLKLLHTDSGNSAPVLLLLPSICSSAQRQLNGDSSSRMPAKAGCLAGSANKNF